MLITNALSKNKAYAERIASTIELYFRVSMEQLAYSANFVEHKINNSEALLQELERLQQQDSGFDGAMFVNASGTVVATYPQNLSQNGTRLNPAIAEPALETETQTISHALVPESGGRIVYLTYPVYSSSNVYLGFVSGLIHLNKQNVLGSLISNHFQNDRSYVYLVDQDDMLFYHPDPTRSGTKEPNNKVVQAAESGGSGSMEVVNSRGVMMLAGYSSVPSSAWGVIAQEPKASTLAPLDTLMNKMILGTLPLSIPGLCILLWLSGMISAPLRRLADGAATLDAEGAASTVMKVNAWYEEAIHIKGGLLKGIDLINQKMKGLSDQANRDHLTGLLNRRATDILLEGLEKDGRSFAIISVDIDHFKRVNDTFGHDVGDYVLQCLARIMADSCRDTDYACRVGGEEFYLILPDTPVQATIDISERIRGVVEQTTIEGVGNITISCGVTGWPGEDRSVKAALKKADELMYQAKRNGRNRTEWE
ncbi:sensor domain-containing diguanylate cyclase [Shimwellia blattae]|uniref:sensor domain-containing diguanylate cyclase n=1 Tax=Shimwellia blattae TaxID=563 RepID=UPI00030C36FE|nr:sensor domain-containing diguanylate cyclase [Shimwellia blattae]